MESAKGHKGGEHCFEGRTFITKVQLKSPASHRGVNNGKSTTKGDGDGVVWSENKEKTHNLGQSYTYGKRY
jgi:hypothetical protein